MNMKGKLHGFPLFCVKMPFFREGLHLGYILGVIFFGKEGLHLGLHFIYFQGLFDVGNFLKNVWK